MIPRSKQQKELRKVWTMRELLESLERYIEVRGEPKPENDSDKRDKLIEEMRAFSDLKRNYLEYKNGNENTVN